MNACQAAGSAAGRHRRHGPVGRLPDRGPRPRAGHPGRRPRSRVRAVLHHARRRHRARAGDRQAARRAAERNDRAAGPARRGHGRRGRRAARPVGTPLSADAAEPHPAHGRQRPPSPPRSRPSASMRSGGSASTSVCDQAQQPIGHRSHPRPEQRRAVQSHDDQARPPVVRDLGELLGGIAVRHQRFGLNAGGRLAAIACSPSSATARRSASRPARCSRAASRLFTGSITCTRISGTPAASASPAATGRLMTRRRRQIHRDDDPAAASASRRPATPARDRPAA